MSPYRSSEKLKRRPQDGYISGVCAGVAIHFNIPVVWVRLAVIFGAFFTGFFPVICAYAALSIVLEQDLGPAARQSSSEQPDADDVRILYDSLEERLKRLESYLTSTEYDWNRKYRNELK